MSSLSLSPPLLLTARIEHRVKKGVKRAAAPEKRTTELDTYKGEVLSPWPSSLSPCPLHPLQLTAFLPAFVVQILWSALATRRPPTCDFRDMVEWPRLNAHK